MSQTESLDFVPVSYRDVLRWDREWAFYIRRFQVGSWFINLAYETDDTRAFKQGLRGLSRQEMLTHKGILDKIELFIDGDELVDAKVAEIGCGAGRLGRQIGHAVKDYVGIDYSRMAVSIAQPLSPGNCKFICIQDKASLPPYFGTRDLVIARHFFIHNNFANALWLLKLDHMLLRPGGTVVADFFIPAGESQGRDFYRLAKEDLDPASASRVFLFSEDEIRELAAATGFVVEEIADRTWTPYTEAVARRFVRFVKPH